MFLFNTGAKHGFPSYHVLFSGLGTYTLTKNKVPTNAIMEIMGVQRILTKNHSLIDVALTIGILNLFLPSNSSKKRIVS